MLLHVLANLVGNLLVKTSQQDAPHHHGGVTTNSTLPGEWGKEKRSSLEMPNSAPGIFGYFGLPPVAKMNLEAVTVFSIPFLLTVLMVFMSTKVAYSFR